MRRYYKYQWGQAVKQDLLAHKAFVHRTVVQERVFKPSILVEIIIALVQPLPFGDYRFTMRAGYPLLDYNFTVSELMYVLMFFKLYIIFRYIISSSVYTNSDANFLWYLLLPSTSLVSLSTISRRMRDMPSSA